MEQGGSNKGKEKVVAPELLACIRCTNHGFNCKLRPGKSKLCLPCIKAKTKCIQPGVEEPEMKCRRKHAEEKDDDDKPQEKPKKKDRRESELEAGPSRKKGSKELEESRTTGQDSELQTLLRRLLARFDPQTISWRSSWS